MLRVLLGRVPQGRVLSQLPRAFYSGCVSAATSSIPRWDGPNSGVSRVGDETIYVGMSGGVDSSTSAALLAQKYGAHRIHGVFMNNWSSLSKCQESSWRAVQQVCGHLNIKCHRVDLERDYWSDVFEPMLVAYQQGDTPNPDVGCNHYIKFGQLVEHLKSYDPQFRWIASGHYAGVSVIDESRALVKRASYMPKDQSYYLATVGTEILNNVLFPLAHLEKPQVRALAAQFGLEDVANKPDSQGLCFVEQQQEVGQRGFRKFLAEYLTEDPGPVVLASDPSVVVGEHKGLWTHTIGQRASVPMPQSSPETRGQWFVVGKDKSRKALLIDRGSNCKRLFVNQVTSDDFRWHKPPAASSSLYAQYRSLQDPWRLKSFEAVGSGFEFKFDVSRRAVAPGQYIVIYEDNAVIGAGTIHATSNLEIQ